MEYLVLIAVIILALSIVRTESLSAEMLRRIKRIEEKMDIPAELPKKEKK